MFDIQHLALDHDGFINEVTEEATSALLKKYRQK